MANIDEKNILIENTKKYAYQLWSLIAHQFEQEISNNERVLSQDATQNVYPKKKWLINLLFFFPFLLLAGFLISFWWDFTGISLSIFGLIIDLEGLLKILSIGGLIGFMTNWVAIKMLFRPTFKRPILGQGLIPAQKDRIAYRLAVAVSNDLINPEIIKQKIQDSKSISKYREQATEYIKHVLDDSEFRSELKILLVSYVDEMIAEPEIRTSVAKAIIDQMNQSIDEHSFERVAIKAYSFIKAKKCRSCKNALTKLPGGSKRD